MPVFVPLKSTTWWNREERELLAPSRSQYNTCKKDLRSVYDLVASAFPSLGSNVGTKEVGGIGPVPNIDFNKVYFTPDLSTVALRDGFVPEWQPKLGLQKDRLERNLPLYQNHMRFLAERSQYPVKGVNGVCKSSDPDAAGGCHGGNCAVS